MLMRTHACDGMCMLGPCSIRVCHGRSFHGKTMTVYIEVRSMLRGHRWRRLQGNQDVHAATRASHSRWG